MKSFVKDNNAKHSSHFEYDLSHFFIYEFQLKNICKKLENGAGAKIISAVSKNRILDSHRIIFIVHNEPDI